MQKRAALLPPLCFIAYRLIPDSSDVAISHYLIIVSVGHHLGDPDGVPAGCD